MGEQQRLRCGQHERGGPILTAPDEKSPQQQERRFICPPSDPPHFHEPDCFRTNAPMGKTGTVDAGCTFRSSMSRPIGPLSFHCKRYSAYCNVLSRFILRVLFLGLRAHRAQRTSQITRRPLDGLPLRLDIMIHAEKASLRDCRRLRIARMVEAAWNGQLASSAG
jgi:hypothetical protein